MKVRYLATVLEEKIEFNQPTSRELGDSWEEQTSSGTIAKASQEYEVVFLADDSEVNNKAFEFAIQSASKFSAKLVLLYVTGRVAVPDAYVEYSNSEGIQDYEWRYYNLIASEKLDSLGRKAESEGLEWRTQVYIGDAKSAVKSYSGRKAIVIVNEPLEKRNFLRFLGLRWEKSAGIAVPVVVY